MWVVVTIALVLVGTRGAPSPSSSSVCTAGEKTAPIPVSDLVCHLRKVEAAFPNVGWQDLATRIRKLYADNSFYGKIIDSRGKVPVLGSNDVLGARDVCVLGSGGKVIRLKTGELVDVSRIFLGIDAHNFPKTSWSLRALGVHAPDASTWAGDVGAALSEYGLQRHQHDKEEASRELMFTRYVSAPVLLGDIDGLAISVLPTKEREEGLSERLWRYYDHMVHMRYRLFCKAAGLGYTEKKDGSLELTQGSKEKITSQIANFARLWTIKHSKWYIVKFLPYSDDDLDWFVHHFTSFVEHGLQHELGDNPVSTLGEVDDDEDNDASASSDLLKCPTSSKREEGVPSTPAHDGEVRKPDKPEESAQDAEVTLLKQKVHELTGALRTATTVLEGVSKKEEHDLDDQESEEKKEESESENEQEQIERVVKGSTKLSKDAKDEDELKAMAGSEETQLQKDVVKEKQEVKDDESKKVELEHEVAGVEEMEKASEKG